MKLHSIRLSLLICLITFGINYMQACSMSKITFNGVTYVGNNEDSWHTDPRIWFEPGAGSKRGACYVGYADKWPQGGMNIDGLVYDAFTMYDGNVQPNGKPIAENLPIFLRDIMQSCGTVDEVYKYAINFDRHNFDRAMMLFVDTTGKYLVMEADTMIIGNDSTFLLANFSFSKTKDLSTVSLGRYQRGRTFLEKHEIGGLDFCRALMDTMSECRERKGDGTLYTSLYDTKRRLISLCFYHNYDRVHILSLNDELAKGEHWIAMETLFPKNEEFETLKSYITPANHITLLPIMLIVVILLLGMAAILSTQWFRQLHLAEKNLQYLRISIAIFNALLAIYIWVIMNEPAVYYFPAPYFEAGRGWINLLSYMPVLTLIVMAATGWLVFRKQVVTTTGARVGFYVNAVVWLLCAIAFAYWGLIAII
ncbi:MAG TPA: hypothetical protein PK511_06580 [Chitinophagales bacterium]|nr:hypothetical protein [Chitinophagales bacterium]HNI54168.1 hypothetical protein [Chitinophagales bacterium]HNM29652.1 hypothetical protein [Chitinophagales bacterium]